MTVNGRRAQLGDRADPATDLVCLDGRRLAAEPLQYWLVNKPRGVVTTLRDPEGRPDIRGLVPDSRARLFPVGRLDRDTEGLVLLTNDGPLHHALLHPSTTRWSASIGCACAAACGRRPCAPWRPA